MSTADIRTFPDARRRGHASKAPDLPTRFTASRQWSEKLAAPLSDEDQTVQPMDDASPTKWHLAHTTWFYEAIVLERLLPGYRRLSDDFHYCFNSYYEALGPRHPRVLRGLLTRPSAGEVRAYRRHVDQAMARLLSDCDCGETDLLSLIELGINHEQQHQELMLTDILSLFAQNPLRPVYSRPSRPAAPAVSRDTRFERFEGGISELGHSGPEFAYDNETPRHGVLLGAFGLADRCVTNGEWLEFMADGGYASANLWLADGWAAVQRYSWRAPGYWEDRDGNWLQMSLEGLLPIDPNQPVSHVSFYEADAYARWRGMRLPTEFEWEVAAHGSASDPRVSPHSLRPLSHGADGGRLAELYGVVWQWTNSAYLPYPGFRPQPGAVGEYNGKFMCNQQVLRGSSCFTPAAHARATYRNFFYPHQRWQMTGVRLAEDAS